MATFVHSSSHIFNPQDLYLWTKSFFVSNYVVNHHCFYCKLRKKNTCFFFQVNGFTSTGWGPEVGHQWTKALASFWCHPTSDPTQTPGGVWPAHPQEVTVSTTWAGNICCMCRQFKNKNKKDIIFKTTFR